MPRKNSERRREYDRQYKAQARIDPGKRERLCEIARRCYAKASMDPAKLARRREISRRNQRRYRADPILGAGIRARNLANMRRAAADPIRMRGLKLIRLHVTARKTGVRFTLTRDDINALWPANDCCPVFGRPFYYGPRNGKQHPDSPSVDRFIPTEGYTKENCFIISTRANLLKRDSSLTELEAIVAWMKKVAK